MTQKDKETILQQAALVDVDAHPVTSRAYGLSMWGARQHLRRLRLIAACCLALLPSRMLAGQDNTCLADKVFVRVGSLLEKQDFQRAKSLLHGLEPCPHLSSIQRFNIGWLYGKAHDSADALRIFKSVSPDVPDQLTHAYAIALAYFELESYQDSVDTLTGLRAQGVFDVKCADLLGVSYSKLGRYDDAYAVMAESIRQNPSNPYGYFNLAALFVDTSEIDKAAQVADMAVAALPQNADALSVRGSIELFQNKAEDAYRDFASAEQLAPRAPDPPFFMALVNFRELKFAEAEKVLRSAIASGIVDSDLHYLLAECLLRVDAADLKDALLELDRAVELNPRSVPARVLRGSTLLEANRPHDALMDLKIARNIDATPQRDTRNTVYLLGRAYLALGQRDEAKAMFAQLGDQFSSNKADTLNQLSEQKMRAALHP